MKRWDELISRIPEDQVFHGVEIGVLKGRNAASLLAARPKLVLLLVDPWCVMDDPDTRYWKSEPRGRHRTWDQNGWDGVIRKVVKTCLVQHNPGRCGMLRMTSLQAASFVGDRSLDFVFIDGDHTYEGCMEDIMAWAPKVKPGGFLSGHDYKNHHCQEWGVTEAVDEVAEARGLEVQTGADYTWFLNLPE